MSRGVARGQPVGTGPDRGWPVSVGRPDRTETAPDDRRAVRVDLDRGQSEVVGVAVLLGVTLVALATLTAAIGGVVQQQAAGADATRVASGFEDALQPVEATGVHRGEVSFTEGRLATAERQLRVYDGDALVATVEVGALVYRNGRHRVAYAAGAVVRGTGDRARFTARPPLTLGGDTLVVGAAALNASGTALGASGSTTVTLRTNVSHDRSTLGRGDWRIAVETATPDPWVAYFEAANASVTTRDVDGDGVKSVVADPSGRQYAYLVVHAMHLELVPDG